MNNFHDGKINSKEFQDNSNLLRALLLIISKDKNIGDHEVRIFIHEGMALGYEKDFCENALKNILQNSFIDQTPPVFFNKENALRIFHVGIRIINEDLNPQSMKIEFLEKIALANNLSGYWKTIAYNKIP
ncbi:MAG: hypothetical protein M0P61_15640 [Ignavibacteriaceae bacterium]|jgi:hypothetical protein|nr:hypothetical protein [Ignavibacteriaceae bacterium]